MLHAHYFIQFSQQVHKIGPIILFPHFAGEETEAHGVERPCPRPQNYKLEPEFNPQLASIQSPCTVANSIRLFGVRIFLRVGSYEPGGEWLPNFMANGSNESKRIFL